MDNVCNGYNVQNMYVSKDRIIEFLDFRIDNPLLSKCTIRQLIPSGNYIIFTFDIDVPEQRAEIKKIQDDWY